MPLMRILGSEIVKLWGLPSVVATVLVTVAASPALAAGLVASSRNATDPAQAVLAGIPYVQVGLILLGVLTAATEYQGSQIRTSLVATPGRLRLLAGKILAYLVVASATATAAVGAGLAAALLTAGGRGASHSEPIAGWPLVGAALYLVLIGLLALTCAMSLRSVVATLVPMLALVLIVSPLLRAMTEHARWLPDQAGAPLYRSATDAVLSPGSGVLVLFAWIAVGAVTGAAVFLTRDA